ncbi:MAG TPA: hypothetical protein VGL95_04065 [Acetobacteraceae bacterium]
MPRAAAAPSSPRLTAGAQALLHDPDRHTRPFPRRHDRVLPFDPAALPADLPLMLDTTVYVHRLQNKIPAPIHALVEARPVLHCAVAIAEIAVSAGIMDPTHATTARYRTPLLGLLHGISVLDIRAPGSRHLGRGRHAGGHPGAHAIRPGAT